MRYAASSRLDPTAPRPSWWLANFGNGTLDRLIAEDPILDLAILDLHEVHPSRLVLGAGEPEFFEPATWPLGTAEPGELIALGGWPSFYRREDCQRHADFGVPSSGAFALGTTRVIDVGIENIVCEPSWDCWLEGEGPQRMDALADLGGLSGGPGFVQRGSEHHLVGVIFAVAQFGDYLRLRPARFIGPDGTLRRE